MAKGMPLDVTNCLNCKYRHRDGRQSSDTRIGGYDKCNLNGLYLSTIVNHTNTISNIDKETGECKRKLVAETVHSSILWVRLYFKGLENEPIVIEQNKHEILIEGGWFVKKVFGIADKFHAWQDRRREKRWIAAEANRKAQILTHIVKELPRA